MRKDRELLEVEEWDVNKPTGNLRNLIILCNNNIKGLTKREEIGQYLPIEFEGLKIEEDSNKLVFRQDNVVIKNVWIDTSCYSNLEILKVIARIYNIEFKSEEILELIKFKNKITLMLL